ncbi:indole-3-glycerol phosphate synthase TrpC [Craurococcus roseus]|uniref:Indole-3-glycerol phosphate synthase n=1 Tax=Craurococcus roseus TaxID=77585 RepID=A0ABN1F1Z9_9PROT
MNAPQVFIPATAEDVPDTLARILADKYEEVRQRSAEFPRVELERLAQAAPAGRDFTRALCNAVAEGRVGLIAEIKRASPSGGLIRDPFEPAALASAYCEGEATCLSVLTDGPYFQGSAEHLREARAACTLPALRKDFIVHPWQIFESRCMGADCVLLIMAALSDAQAQELEDVARSLDMAVLAEVHDERELDRALGLETRLIGINNRDLRTLRTDLATAEALAPLVPADRIPVAESGIRTDEDVRRMAAAGARCILVGEHLLRQADVAEAARALVHAL